MPRTPPQYGCYALSYLEHPGHAIRTVEFFPNVSLANIEAEHVWDREPAIEHCPTTDGVWRSLYATLG